MLMAFIAFTEPFFNRSLPVAFNPDVSRALDLWPSRAPPNSETAYTCDALFNFDALAAVSGHWGAYAFATVFGLLWGSFANVCIYRWPPTDAHPNGRSVVTPPSHCFVCGANVKWYDNVPLLSYLWLRGRCRNCKTGFSPRYLIVEALTGVLFGLAWWFAMHYPDAASFQSHLLRFAVYAGFAFFIVVVTFIDLDHMLILDKLTFPSIPIFYGLGLWLGHPWQQGLIGAAVGYGIIVAIRLLYYALRKREGMGLGDAKLLAVVGAIWGWQGVMVALFGGSVIGTVVAIIALFVVDPDAHKPPTANDSNSVAPKTDSDAVSADRAPDTNTAADHSAGAPATDGGGMGGLALPFGPFLAAAAMAYAFAHPYFVIGWR